MALDIEQIRHNMATVLFKYPWTSGAYFVFGVLVVWVIF